MAAPRKDTSAVSPSSISIRSFSLKPKAYLPSGVSAPTIPVTGSCRPRLDTMLLVLPSRRTTPPLRPRKECECADAPEPACLRPVTVAKYAILTLPGDAHLVDPG